MGRLDLLETIPGVDRRGAAMLLVEIGTEMTAVPRDRCLSGQQRKRRKAQEYGLPGVD